MSHNRGFTLIELLVVVAIIGLLASIVIASLNTARQKGRDARRVADIRQLQHALELCNDSNTGACQYGYPSSTTPTASTSTLASYIGALPKDPSTGRAYAYISLGPTAGPYCTGYHMGAVLENTSNTALNSAAKLAAVATVCNTSSGVWGDNTTGHTADFNGLSSACNTAGSAGCYDVKM